MDIFITTTIPNSSAQNYCQIPKRDGDEWVVSMHTEIILCQNISRMYTSNALMALLEVKKIASSAYINTAS